MKTFVVLTNHSLDEGREVAKKVFNDHRDCFVGYSLSSKLFPMLIINDEDSIFEDGGERKVVIFVPRYHYREWSRGREYYAAKVNMRRVPKISGSYIDGYDEQTQITFYDLLFRGGYPIVRNERDERIKNVLDDFICHTDDICNPVLTYDHRATESLGKVTGMDFGPHGDISSISIEPTEEGKKFFKENSDVVGISAHFEAIDKNGRVFSIPKMSELPELTAVTKPKHDDILDYIRYDIDITKRLKELADEAYADKYKTCMEFDQMCMYVGGFKPTGCKWMKDTYLKFEKELEKCHDIDYPWEKALAEELAAYYNPGSPSEHWHAVNNMVGKWIKAEAEKCDITYPEVVKRDILYELKAMPSKKLFEYLLDHSGMDTKNCVVMARNIGRTAYLQSIKETCEKLKNLPNGSKEKEDLKRALNTVYGNYCYGITPKWICQEIENPELDKYVMWTRYNGELIPDPQCVVKVKKENEEMGMPTIKQVIYSESKKTGELMLTVILQIGTAESKTHISIPNDIYAFGVRGSIMLAVIKHYAKPGLWHMFSEWVMSCGADEKRLIKDFFHALPGPNRYPYWKNEVERFVKENPQGSKNFVLQDGKKNKKTEPEILGADLAHDISDSVGKAMNTLKEACDEIANPES